MKILSIIPARSGSKGIKNKNMTKFLGQPLIKHTIEFSKKLPNTTTFVSTDSIKILRYAQKNNIKFDYLRPKKLSKDNSNISDAILHALKWFYKKNIIFDYFLLLQPTSPIRSYAEVIKILNFSKKKKISSVVSATRMTEHPYECLELNYNGRWKYLVKNLNKKIYLRQEYKNNYYFIDGSIYLVKVDFFTKNKTLISENSTKIFRSKIKRQVDINTYEDLKIAELLYKKIFL
jgi:CMP-N-acetylneuraminic acid synthetase